MNVSQLKNLTLDRHDLDEKMALHADALALASSYAMFGEVSPEWLKQCVALLDADIKAGLREKQAAELARIDRELASLRSREEVRADLQARQRQLQARLGNQVPTVNEVVKVGGTD